MVIRLVSGILTTVFIPLGITFTVLGLTLDEGSAAFLATGLPLLALGLACAGTFVVAHRREIERRRRRQAGPRVQARIVRAVFKPHTQNGALLTYDLTVSFPAGGTVTQRQYLIPGTDVTEGSYLEICYDPAEPSNFQPVKGTAHPLPRPQDTPRLD